jgi:hypothetical protein
MGILGFKEIETMKNYSIRQIQDGVLLIIKNIYPEDIILDKKDGVYLCSYGEPILITATALKDLMSTHLQFQTQDEALDGFTEHLGTEIIGIGNVYNMLEGETTVMSFGIYNNTILTINNNGD